MMLARFVLQDCSQTSSQHAVSAVTPQRAIINIAVQAVCYTNEPAAGYIHVIHSLMMLARFGAAGLHRPAVNMRLSTPQRAIINIASAGSVLHK
jgi:hypothetical protein